MYKDKKKTWTIYFFTFTVCAWTAVSDQTAIHNNTNFFIP